MGRFKPKTRQTPKSVTRGRPPLAKSTPTLSAKATRTLIRSHHNLRKAHAAALAISDIVKVASIEAEIESNGGLDSYQLASVIGQSSPRGGDSSKVLCKWLQTEFSEAQTKNERLRMLEIGALSVQNACSKIPCLDIDRIDLHSQAPQIREIDFMDLPIPVSEAGKYHLVSLSLVLNFVPEASARGEMLRRIPRFLQNLQHQLNEFGSHIFLVLPLPCILKSRYMDENRLSAIMQSLGFTKSHVKQTAKLHYSLWTYDGGKNSDAVFEKKEIHPGGKRNNFSIVLQ